MSKMGTNAERCDDKSSGVLWAEIVPHEYYVRVIENVMFK